MVKHIWLNMDISIPLLLDSTSKTKFYVDEIAISISNIPVYIFSSFEGNMPEIHFYVTKLVTSLFAGNMPELTPSN